MQAPRTQVTRCISDYSLNKEELRYDHKAPMVEVLLDY